MPYAINPNQSNLQEKTGFIYTALLLVCIAFVSYFVPESKGRIYSKIDQLWELSVPVWKRSKHELIVVQTTKADKDADGV